MAKQIEIPEELKDNMTTKEDRDLQTELKNWNKQDICELLELLDCIYFKEIETDTEIHIDMSSLPTVPIPSDIDIAYPVWAMDVRGNCLVGDDAQVIQHIDEIRYRQKMNITKYDWITPEDLIPSEDSRPILTLKCTECGAEYRHIHNAMNICAVCYLKHSKLYEDRVQAEHAAWERTHTDKPSERDIELELKIICFLNDLAEKLYHDGKKNRKITPEEAQTFIEGVTADKREQENMLSSLKTLYKMTVYAKEGEAICPNLNSQ